MTKETKGTEHFFRARQLGLWCAALIFSCCATAEATTLDEARGFHRNGEYDAALAAYQSVVKSQAPDSERAVARNNACAIYTDQGQFDTAIAYCREALTMRRALADWRGVARTLGNLGRALEAKGDLSGARAAHEQSLTLNLQREDVPAQIVNHINLAVLETQDGRHAQALDQLARTEPLLDQVDAGWARGQRALASLNRAVVLERVGAYREALASIDQALTIAEEAAPHLLADAFLNRGVILRNLGDATSALDAYRRAEATFTSRGNRVAALNARLNEAIVQWRDLNDNDAAEHAVKHVLEAAEFASSDDVREALYVDVRLALDRRNTGHARSSAERLIGLAPDEALSLDAMARLNVVENRLDEAIDYARSAIAVIEANRATLDDDRHRQSLLTDRRAAYALAIDLLHERHTLSGKSADFQAALDYAARGKALGLIESLSPTAAVHEIESGIRYVETFFSGPRLHTWTLEENSATWATLDAPPIRRAARLIAKAAASGLALPSDELRILEAVTGSGGPGQLVIAPDQALVSVPFDLLYFDRVRAPVIRHVAAVTLDLRSPSPVTAEPATLLAIAGGMIPDDLAGYPALRGLAALASVDQEIDAIRNHFGPGVTVLAGSGATEQAFIDHGPASVQHIASHAIFDSGLNDGAVLVLGPDQNNDGLLFPRDILRLSRPARLTVLSGCSTARGSATAGAPIRHLAGAFLASGSRAVIASLWDVDDTVTAVVMQQFYARLADGMLPHEALHATKRFLSSQPDWDSPSIWAPWVVYGPSDHRIFTPRSNTRTQAAIALVLSSLALFVFGLWRQSANNRRLNL